MSEEIIQQNSSDFGVFVYVAEFDDGVVVNDVLPPIRNDAIAEANDPMLKRQRYCVWRLLDCALRETLGNGVEELTFNKDENGKWSCDGAYFSLSHSGHAVAVAVCLSESVGVDIEYIDKNSFNSRLAERILTKRELLIYNNVKCETQKRAIAEFWTKKEAVFKRDGGKSFAPSAIDTLNYPFFSQILQLSDGSYCLAVSSANNLPVKLCRISKFEW